MIKYAATKGEIPPAMFVLEDNKLHQVPKEVGEYHLFTKKRRDNSNEHRF